MKQVKLTIMAALLALLMATAYGGQTGTVEKFSFPDDPPATQTQPDNPTPPTPVSAPPTPAPSSSLPPAPATKGDKGDQGDKGDLGTPGAKGDNGNPGATGKGQLGRTGARGPAGLPCDSSMIDEHIKHWNALAKNGVALLINHYFNKHKLVGLADRVTALEVAANTQSAAPTKENKKTDEKNHSIVIPLWVWLLLAAILAWIFWNQIRKFIGWLRNMGYITGYGKNKASGWLGSRRVSTGKVSVPMTDQIKRYTIIKLWKNLSDPDGEWHEGDCSHVPHSSVGQPGDYIAFRLIYKNHSGRPLSDDRVVLTDHPDLEKFALVDGETFCWINRDSCKWRLPDEMAQAFLIEGKGLSMKNAAAVVIITDYKHALPAGGKFFVQAVMQITDDIADQGFDGELVEVPPEIVAVVAQKKAETTTESEKDEKKTEEAKKETPAEPEVATDEEIEGLLHHE